MKYAVVHHADLIALTRGPSSLRRMLFGSTALELMRHSGIPLFMAHSTDSPRDIRKILVPVDGSRTSQGIFPVVADLARGAGARVALLTVLSHEGNADPARRALERVGRSPTFARVPVETVVRSGEAVPGILESARAEGADVIALGTHGRTGSNRFFFGSVAEEVLSRAEVPVILRRTQKLPARMPRPASLAHAVSSSSAQESP
jgi:nucleotide-binding universal stress UspA family protein